MADVVEHNGKVYYVMDITDDDVAKFLFMATNLAYKTVTEEHLEAYYDKVRPNKKPLDMWECMNEELKRRGFRK